MQRRPDMELPRPTDHGLILLSAPPYRLGLMKSHMLLIPTSHSEKAPLGGFGLLLMLVESFRCFFMREA
jgi:hypothetical protein